MFTQKTRHIHPMPDQGVGPTPGRCSLSREYDYIFFQIDCAHVRSAATYNNSIYRSSRGPVPGQSLRQRTNTKTGPGQYRIPTSRYTSINKVWGLMSQTMQTSAQTQANPANTKKRTIPVQRRTNVEATLNDTDRPI